MGLYRAATEKGPWIFAESNIFSWDVENAIAAPTTD
jgi:hypothetical protein